jgi:glycosyltransferase involved in cell wall biosynthesis
VPDLPVVLVLGRRPVRLQSPRSAAPGATRELECRWYPGDEDLGAVLAREHPDVIASFGPRAEFPRLAEAPYDVRRRWLHFEPAAPAAADLERAGAMVFALFLHRALASPRARVADPAPLVSVFTPTYRTGPRIQRTYRSLRSQSHDHWEWVVLDDSHDGGVTRAMLEEIARDEPRLAIYSAHRPSGRIGEVKRQACALSRGAILVELDHDDELTPDALADVVRALADDPGAGFAYSDWAMVDEESGECLTYGDDWAWGYGRYRIEPRDGRPLLVATAPPINAHTIRHIVSVPNHLRAWRRDAYWRIGGHNPALHVADDYELLLRTFLQTRMTHIPRLCYVQHLDRGRSAQDLRRGEIQRLVHAIRAHYEDRIHARLEELGLPDPLWTGPAVAGRPPDDGAVSPG